MAPLLSVVVPMYNEQDALGPLTDRLRPALDAITADYEVVAVDDGSTDGTARQVAELMADWPQVRLIRLRRNAGHQAALTAGLHRARGEYVVSIDADLQDPPEKIGEMLALARRDHLDVVYGVRADRGTDTVFKRSTAGAYYVLMRRLVGSWVPRDAGDFRLLSRTAVDALTALPDHQPVYRLLVPALGFPSGTVRYVREERVAGTTKYPVGKMIRLAVDSVTNFSAAPLRLATWLGVLSFCGCLVMIVFGVVVYAVGSTVPGWTSLFVAVLFLGALQLTCLGLLGEYVARIYSTVQARPTYHIGTDTAARAEEKTPA
ncbi:glycosyltransferase family 2 protein [Actinocatenispora rupis]|uniref:Glucosyl transferase n=1 Tax=Actinocatenispora rupis TaxID=519421 RepID=A0A8J3IW55_9ACTN|nr:glycosyltransferase family 2 protein [Actinocatenispora rupis]GID09788.1 glucosyl transferase [Actinocatenispora rupis]